MSLVFRAAFAVAAALAVIANATAIAQTTEQPPETTQPAVTPGGEATEAPKLEQAAPPATNGTTSGQDVLPTVVVPQANVPKSKPKPMAKKVVPTTRPIERPAVPPVESVDSTPMAAPAGSSGGDVQPGTRSGSLTVPTVAEARAEINQTPGGVALVPGTAYQESTPAVTLKDILDYVPGVFVQPKWGEDSRLSIRGSGLSRNFHLRSVQLFMDGIPMNTSDGYGDFQEIDPTVYKYVEVYKGANALQYGANSLGGAINFVMPSGYNSDLARVRTDFGSFDFKKVAASSGAVVGPMDYFINTTWQEETGFREHSAGESVRGSANIGYRFNSDLETRFYINANRVEQQIPGEVTKEVALNDPKEAAPINVLNDWQRNIDSVRLANKTAMRLAPDTLLEMGIFGINRHLMHPIFLWLDYRYDDHGGFARLTDESLLFGHRNRVVTGLNVINGSIDADLFLIGPNAEKGALVQSADQSAVNGTFYFEDSFYFLPRVALVGGTQFLHAERRQKAILNTVSGENTFNLWSPKVGLLWDVDPTWQIYGNISRSAEVPSFDEGAGLVTFDDIKAQTATTYEIGTRGRRPDYTWDISLYHANVHDELQCLGDGTDFCNVVNVPRTVHQGLEFGLGLSLLKSMLVNGPAENTDRLWLNTAYTFSDFFFVNDPDFGDNELPGVPRHYIRSELLYKHPVGFFVGPNVEWVPEAYFVDNANTLDTQFYALWGAKVGFERGMLSAYVEGRNLTDRNYIATVDIVPLATEQSPLFWPGNGRAVYAGLQLKW